MRPQVFLFILLIALVGQSIAQESVVQLHSGWKAKKASEVLVDGTTITSKNFHFFGWMDAVVPGTVLTTLLHNQKVPDPFFGMNNELIPDIYQTGVDEYTYWFYIEFQVPEWQPDQQVWLNFRGINYTADVFLNGKRVNTDTHEGMFLREKYRITPFLEKGTNRLAVIVHPPDPPGKPDGQGGDGVIGRSVAMQFTAGWDWICPIRDRNTGIWDEVSLETTGLVDLRDPFIRTRVPGKRLPSGKQEPAFIAATADLVNTSGEKLSGRLIARCGQLEVSKTVELAPETQQTVALPEIKLDNPQLWWPNGVGEHPLYTMEFSFILSSGKASNQESVTFGIRETGNRFDEKLRAQIFSVNGQDIFIKGGNWIASDALLRLSPERYEAEVKMHAGMNMNMIRVWGGAMTERPEFYEACDKYGLLVWQDLWISGDCNGRWFDPMKKESQERRRAYPDKHSLFVNSVIDQVKMLRNHPSLYLWCGGNEFPPPADIDKILKKEVFPQYDGTRFYLNESTSTELAQNTLGGNGDGPYGIQNPANFFTVTSYPFNPELGSVGVPNVETMRKIMEEKDLRPPVDDRANTVWRYHKYLGYGNFINQYGRVDGIDDFCKKAQLVNYEQYRALQEGFNAGMWNKYTGMLVWKNQNPWTALRGQFYDVFLEQNGGFYGQQHGAVPLHIQLNLNDSTACIVNQTVFDQKDLSVSAELFDIHGKLISEEKYPALVKANSVTVLKKVNTKLVNDDVFFLRFKLKDREGALKDENFYWLAKAGKSYEKLNELKPVELQIEIDQNAAQISNPSGETAFFIRLKLVDEKSGELVLPVFMSDNYITLLSGEKKKITIDRSLLPELVKGKSILLVAEGWNAMPKSVKID
jgi:hypothetical protein